VVQQQQQFAVLELWQLLLLELWRAFVPSTGSAAITSEAQ
tara:strand:+ start:395 stop:514 length:120 start_codon:yes stop_codon:yes gene_type:complete